jgi:subtilase family serine protease
MSKLRCRAALQCIAFSGLALCAFTAASGAGVNVSAGQPLLVQAVPQAVSTGQSRIISKLDGTRQLKLALHLPVSDQADLDTLLQQLYDPSSAKYHQYLSVDEFTARFGPSQSDYDAVVAWAQAQGLTVTQTTRNRHIVDVAGSVSTINSALHVVMSNFHRATAKSQFFAPDREPTVNLSVPLLQITGLDNFSPPQSKLRQAGSTGGANAGTGSGPGGEFFPSDMRAAYYGGTLTGAGQTIGIFSFDGYIDSDVPDYYTLLHITNPNVPVTKVLVSGYSGVCDAGDGSGTTACDDGEQVLDIVNSVGMAPGVSEVIFYEGLSGPDILNQMAVDNLAKVISCSWGSGDLGGDDVMFQEMKAQGQTFLNATGDDGAYDAASWLPPSANPLILQVGGTDLVTSGPGGSWMSESGWPDSGGGFYAPAGYDIPSYQSAAGVINPTNQGSTTLRNDPDVAAEANGDNPVIINGVIHSGYGGTSFAAPRWAGYITLLNEQSVGNGAGTSGYINPSLYTIALGANYASNFHDSTTGSN